MLWIAFAVVQALYIVSGIRGEQRAGMWSWSKFFFSLGFAGVEWLILMAAFTWGMAHRRYFGLVVTTGSTVAVLNFIWFIIAARRWKLPDGRTSLQAYRDQQKTGS
jgi:hypothetical protein